MSRKRRPGLGVGSPPRPEEQNINASDLNGSKSEKLAVDKPNDELVIQPPTELGRRVDKELDADRNYFKRWPQRQHYIRRIFPNERAQMEEQARAMGDEFPPATFDPSVHAIFIAVKKIRPNARVRVTFIAKRDIETDLSERDAKEVFGWVSSPKVEWIVAGIKAMGP
jgi:hypothetical protein